MNIKIFQNISLQTKMNIWIFFVIFSLLLFFMFSGEGYLKIDVIFVWVLSCIAIILQFRNNIQPLSSRSQKAIILVGILLCIFSFINIPIGFGNPPYSIGDFTLLISGIGLIYFGLQGNKSCILPVTLPAIAVLGFQMYELFIRNQEWITAPLIPLIVTISMFLLHNLGIPAIQRSNMISFNSLTNETVRLAIVSDCTGIWSLGTFTVTALIVLSSFKEARTKSGLFLICIGYIGTFAANLGRIILIALSGYYYGPAGLIETVHIHAGWIMFSLWMIIFWYYFFTRQLGYSVKLPPFTIKR